METEQWLEEVRARVKMARDYPSTDDWQYYVKDVSRLLELVDKLQCHQDMVDKWMQQELNLRGQEFVAWMESDDDKVPSYKELQERVLLLETNK